jgi:hypothetical protein
MRTLKNFVSLASYFIILSACVKDLDVQPPYQGNKPVVNAWLCGEEGLIVHLSYSLNPVGTFYFDSIGSLTISDAKVILLENSIEVCSLQYSGEGIYTLPEGTDFQPIPGNAYSITIDSPEYGRARSSEIIFPKPVPAAHMSFSNIGNALYENHERGLFRIVLDWQIHSPTFVALEFHSDQMDHHDVFWADEFRYNFTDACEAESPFGIILSNECGYSDKDTLNLITHIQFTNYQKKQYFSGMYLRIISVNREYFSYTSTMNYFLDDNVDVGLLFGASDPHIFKGNIEGGYGLFYAKNTTIIEIPPFINGEE